MWRAKQGIYEPHESTFFSSEDRGFTNIGVGSMIEVVSRLALQCQQTIKNQEKITVLA
jgi:hypothetical protein